MDYLKVLRNSGEEKVEKAKKATSRKRTESDYLKILNRARNINKVQLIKSAEMKKASVVKACSEIARGNYTLDRLKAEFNGNVERLLDSKRFHKACGEKLVPHNIATHIAFDGASKIDLVLKNGLNATYSIQLPEMVDPIFTELELKCATEPECEGCPAPAE